jgi:flagellar hook assembly protein FlgD
MLTLAGGRAIRLTRYPSLGVEGGPGASDGRPLAYVLGSSYPNPSSGRATISYQLPQSGRVELCVYNLAGQLVRTLVRGERPAGANSATWDGLDDHGRRVAGGIYLYQMRTNGFTSTTKSILLR